MAEAIQVEGEGARSSKVFYMKFKTWDGKTIGPFKYDLDFGIFAQEKSQK